MWSDTHIDRKNRDCLPTLSISSRNHQFDSIEDGKEYNILNKKQPLIVRGHIIHSK